MSSGVDDFDLDAAWIRRAQTDLRAFMEALAVRLETALPGRVTVERRRDGLLARTSHVREIAIQGDAVQHRLLFDKGVLKPTRAKTVRGVVISTAELAFPQWLAEVRGEVQALAGSLGSASESLEGFL